MACGSCHKSSPPVASNSLHRRYYTLPNPCCPGRCSATVGSAAAHQFHSVLFRQTPHNAWLRCRRHAQRSAQFGLVLAQRAQMQTQSTNHMPAAKPPCERGAIAPRSQNFVRRVELASRCEERLQPCRLWLADAGHVNCWTSGQRARGDRIILAQKCGDGLHRGELIASCAGLPLKAAIG